MQFLVCSVWRNRRSIEALAKRHAQYGRTLPVTIFPINMRRRFSLASRKEVGFFLTPRQKEINALITGSGESELITPLTAIIAWSRRPHMIGKCTDAYRCFFTRPRASPQCICDVYFGCAAGLAYTSTKVIFWEVIMARIFQLERVYKISPGFLFHKRKINLYTTSQLPCNCYYIVFFLYYFILISLIHDSSELVTQFSLL